MIPRLGSLQLPSTKRGSLQLPSTKTTSKQALCLLSNLNVTSFSLHSLPFLSSHLLGPFFPHPHGRMTLASNSLLIPDLRFLEYYWQEKGTKFHRVWMHKTQRATQGQQQPGPPEQWVIHHVVTTDSSHESYMIKGEYPILTSSSSQDHSGSFVMCCYVLHQVITIYGSRNRKGNSTTVSVKFGVKRDKCI